MVHSHRCRFPLACETHKVPNLFVLRSVLSRLRLHFPEQGPPFCLIMMYCHIFRFCSLCPVVVAGVLARLAVDTKLRSLSKLIYAVSCPW